VNRRQAFRAAMKLEEIKREAARLQREVESGRMTETEGAERLKDLNAVVAELRDATR
jgi:hypothetical protein